MSWVTIIWSMIAAACLTLGAMHLLVWCRNRTTWANLFFALTAIATAGVAAGEFWMMRAATTAEFGTAVRWLHVPAWLMIVSLVGFVHLYLRAGRPWLAWAVCGLRTLSLLLNFVFTPNLNYREITSLRHIRFLGESVSVGEGVSNPWMLVGQASLALLVVYTVDATITAWRRGSRRQALWLGGAIVFFSLAGTGQAVLVFWEVVHTPITASLFFLCIVAAMGYELSHDVLRAAQLSAELRDSEERMTLAAEAAGFGVWMWDIAGDRVWGSERWLHLFGFAPDEAVSLEKVLDRIHPDDCEIVERELRRALEDQSAYTGEYRVVLPNGTQRWIAGRGRVYPDTHGNPARMMGAAIDIAERKQAEAALKESEGRFRQVAEIAGEFIWEVDAHGRYTYASPSVERILGYAPEELVGKRHFFDLFAPSVREELKATALQMFAERKSFKAFPNSNVSKRGKIVHLETSGAPVLDSAGNLVAYRGADTDITARREAELELQQQRDELAHLSRVATVSELSGSLAHELNQPLGIILSNAQAAQELLLQDPPVVAEVSEILVDIVAADLRAAEIIRRLRSMLKRGEVSRQPLSLNEVIEEVLRLVRVDLIGRGVTAVCHLAPDLPPVTGDRVQLQQLTLNLILNAVDAMAATPAGARRLHLTTARQPHAVRASVRDEGVGLPADVERLFQPFYTTKAQGLGMGLAICRSIITAHRGRLWAEPHPEKGAVFHFELPISEGASGQWRAASGEWQGASGRGQVARGK